MKTRTGSSVVNRFIRYASSSSSVTSVLSPPHVVVFFLLSRSHSSSSGSSPPFRFLFSAFIAAASRSLSRLKSPSPRPCFFRDELCSWARSRVSLRSVVTGAGVDLAAAVLSSCWADDDLRASMPALPVQYELESVEWQHAKPHSPDPRS